MVRELITLLVLTFFLPSALITQIAAVDYKDKNQFNRLLSV